MPHGVYDHHNTKTPIYTKERNQKIADIQRGRKPTPEQTAKRIASFRGKTAGERHWNWRGGKTEKNKLLRTSAEFKHWREDVFKRDDYICQFCHKRGGILHPDHIKPLSLYPELCFELNNGRTLCAPCHRKTPTWGSRTKASFIK